MTTFKELGLSSQTLKALEKKGFTTPTEIQEKTIPLLLKGARDIVGQSQTGTGKTASFALPILENFKPSEHVQALVLAPTRELAVQVKDEIDSLKGDKEIRTLTVYGGAPIDKQIQKLKSGVDIVVGTPGRILDLMDRKVLKLKMVDMVVLDEADEMLNMGFVDDIENILAATKKERQMLLFSATMPKGILKIAQRFMGDYEHVAVKPAQTTTELTEQIYYSILPDDRIECLRRVIDIADDFYGIVFCTTKSTTDVVAQRLSSKNYKAAALHGDISQNQREQILAAFKARKLNVLIATDVAARGIDVNDLTHVINYSLPQSPELYVHRIGRTGRAGKKGIAITFVVPAEQGKLRFVEKIVGQKLTKAPIPTIDELRLARENRHKDIIERIIAKGSPRFTNVADELLSKYDSKQIILALIQYNLKDQFSERREIKEPESRRRAADREDRASSKKRSERMDRRVKKKSGRRDSVKTSDKKSDRRSDKRNKKRR